MPTEFLFSYGTLQLEQVQLATFGRRLNGTPDVLTGFKTAPLVIEDPHVVAVSGKSVHMVAQYSGRHSDTLSGTVYQLTPEEIQGADDYEVAPCKRVLVVLQSGTSAWVYVDGRHAPPDLQVAQSRAKMDNDLPD